MNFIVEEQRLLEDVVMSENPPLPRIVELCRILADENVAYCHWKSNNALDRSASGENDLDLLVSRGDASRFSAILHRLGFKEATPEPQKQMVGVVDYYGYDEDVSRLIHVHAHYQLVLGHDMTKNFRLPIETAYIDSAVQADLFKIPAPEFEFIVLVIRLILKHSTWDVVLGKAGVVRKAERQELDYLQARIDPARVDAILEQFLPYIGADLFNGCVNALQSRCSTWVRVRTAQQLQVRLQANIRHPLPVDVVQKQTRGWTRVIRQRIFKSPSRHRLNTGGMMIAIVGGDGAGKTTLVSELHAWLSKDFDTRVVHVGKPKESLPTIVVRAMLRLGTLVGLYPHLNSSSLIVPPSSRYPGRIPWMMREALKARDRYLTYLRARRFVNNGGIVICDRFPLPQIKLMDGPVIGQIAHGNSDWLSRSLMKFERRYYQLLTMPELVILLRLDPEEAVRRKTKEDPIQVRARSMEIWKTDWRESGVHVIDAHRPQAEVLATVKSLIWSKL